MDKTAKTLSPTVAVSPPADFWIALLAEPVTSDAVAEPDSHRQMCEKCFDFFP
ncbi:hypothetical protein BGZ81_002042, partial [Podila clonocystis]